MRPHAHACNMAEPNPAQRGHTRTHARPCECTYPRMRSCTSAHLCVHMHSSNGFALSQMRQRVHVYAGSATKMLRAWPPSDGSWPLSDGRVDWASKAGLFYLDASVVPTQQEGPERIFFCQPRGMVDCCQRAGALQIATCHLSASATASWRRPQHSPSKTSVILKPNIETARSVRENLRSILVCGAAVHVCAYMRHSCVHHGIDKPEMVEKKRSASFNGRWHSRSRCCKAKQSKGQNRCTALKKGWGHSYAEVWHFFKKRVRI